MEFSTGMTILTVTVGILSVLLLIAITFIGFNYFAFTKRIRKEVDAQIKALKIENESLSVNIKDVAISALHYNTGMICKKQKEYELAFYSFASGAKIFGRLRGKSTENQYNNCILNLSYLVDMILEEKVSIAYTKKNYEELITILSNIKHEHKNKILAFALTHVGIR